MIDVFLDPYMLAVPPSDAPSSMVELYADALSDWDALWREQKTRMWKSRDVHETLYLTVSLPTHDHLKEMLRQWGIHHQFTANDILSTIEGLLQNSATVEDVLEIETFAADEVEPTSFSLFPDRPAHFAQSYETLLMLALLHSIQRGENPIRPLD